MTQSPGTIAFLGCGNMGSSILIGLLDAIPFNESHGESTWNFTACTKTEKSAIALAEKLGHHAKRVRILHEQNKKALEEADVIILGVKPYLAKKVLGETGICQALDGKLVISLMAGVSTEEVQDMISSVAEKPLISGTYIAKAVPTVAARYRQSMTLVERCYPPLPLHQEELVFSIFNYVGSVKFLDPELMDVGSVLVTACLATITVALDGLLDGSVIEGLPRRDASELMAQGIAGLGVMLQNGSHPAILRESISSPRGVTIQTLLAVERENTRVTFTDALLSGTQHLQRARASTVTKKPTNKETL